MKNTLETALDSLKEKSEDSEIAFFGGSFTAIDREYMLSLLDATVPYIDYFKGIRISTRPDYISKEILTLLKSYKVTAIELGAQSMDDDVLEANNRGHKAIDVVNASKLIKEFKISLGLQMMTGLYKSTIEKDIYTARKFIELKPDTVRIYPTVILKGTKLESLYKIGRYLTYTLDETISLCSELLVEFEKSDVTVIRLGLHHSESLEREMIAGVYHPAFRELCESKIMLDKVLELLIDENKEIEHNVLVSPRCVSKLIGNNKSNINRLNELGYKIKVVQNNNIPYMDVVLG